MLNRASSKLSHPPRIRVAQLVVPEVATDVAAGASAAEVTPDARFIVATSHIGSRRSPIGIPWTVPVCCLVAAWALQTLTARISIIGRGSYCLE